VRPRGWLARRALAAALLALSVPGLPGSPAGLEARQGSFAGGHAVPEAPQESSLTLERLFASAEFFGEWFGPARWLDGERYTTLEPSRTLSGGSDMVAYRAASGEREVLVRAEALVPPGTREPLEVEGYEWSKDGTRLLIFTNTRRVWRDNTRGDYWVLDRATGGLTRLGSHFPEATLMFAKFSPDGTRVAYVQAHDLYVETLAGAGAASAGDGAEGAGSAARVTVPSEEGARPGAIPLTTDGSRTTINGTFDWVYEEEFGLQDGFRWSPDGSRIAYWQLDASGIRDFLLINNTDSLYSFTIPIQYPKAGTKNSAARVGVVPAGGGETVWMALEGDPRNHYPARMEWAASSNEIVIQYLNRLQNRLEVTLGDAATGEVRSILTETDEAWLDVVDDLVWLGGGESFTWVSERDGWRRLYQVSRDGEAVTALTPEGEDVLSVELVDQEGGWVYYVASPDDPKTRYLFRVPLGGIDAGAGPSDGGTNGAPAGSPTAAQRLSPMEATGTHSYQLAPGGAWAIHTFSRFDDPPAISLVSLPRHRAVRTLVSNELLRARVRAVRRSSVEFVRVGLGEGLELDGWIMKPAAFDPARRYPVLVYVYGEPAGQTVLDSWGGHSMLWHHYLTQAGYVVVSLDPRGTPGPRGREWRKVVYGEVGTHASHDIAMGLRALLARRSYLDPERVAIWGWSGGGSQTLNCLFRYPDLFGTGMAVAPVPDQRYYDTVYQERYMGLPLENAEGYAKGSPITYAHQLEGKLLLVHGTGDDNVHYQGTEALMNRLIEAGKPFDMMAYPNRSHGIYEGPGTTLHVYSLLTRYLTTHVPAGGR
jgi:dipeptidyl-peptidase 4